MSAILMKGALVLDSLTGLMLVWGPSEGTNVVGAVALTVLASVPLAWRISERLFARWVGDVVEDEVV